MKNYTVLARKYRPAIFSELLGQDVLIQTLLNAIITNRLHHAYLLTGIRGVGKTTTARIIAKNLNCDTGITANPCQTCYNCTAIAHSSHPDILEFDAASNTGIEDVKDLIEGINYAPVTARKKVYIVDEVHMLSTKAFNALLKTLEEPPQNVVFIFATTEVQKVPITILSRCQRFYLRALASDELTGHLMKISANEGVNITPEAASLIAIKGDGSVRDSLSLLDQVIVSVNIEGGLSGEITKEAVLKSLNIPSYADAIEFVESVFSGKTTQAIEQYNRFLLLGINDIGLVTDLMDLVNKILKDKIGSTRQDLILSKEEAMRVKHLSQTTSVPFLMRFWHILTALVQELRLPGLNRSKMEVGIVRMCYASSLPTPEELILRLKNEDINKVISEFGEDVKIIE
jgi:DNA polymerase-3 subunit gamma/tau